jgi:hypothetical protein
VEEEKERGDAMRKILLAIIIFLSAIQGAAAWSVTNISIEPSGSLTPGTPVMVSVKIDFPERPATPQNYELWFSTDLEKPIWIWNVITDGYENPHRMYPQKNISLYENEISTRYPFAVRLSLEGIAPSVTHTSDITILRIEELDETGEISASERIYEYHATVINPSDITPQSLFWKYDLQGFRTDIDEFAAMGVNTTGAEAKYQTAKTKIDVATALSESQYTAALENITAARADIAEGERLLDKALAEKEVAEAEVPIHNVDNIIAWFKANKSTADDEKLPSIIAQRDLAAAALSSANNEIADGNYSQARAMALEAFQIANTLYNEAVSCQRESICCDNPILLIIYGSGTLVAGTGIGVIVLLIAGIFWWRKRKA